MKRADLIRREVELVELTCASCRGQGRDPFDVMSSLFTCLFAVDAARCGLGRR